MRAAVVDRVESPRRYARTRRGSQPAATATRRSSWGERGFCTGAKMLPGLHLVKVSPSGHRITSKPSGQLPRVRFLPLRVNRPVNRHEGCTLHAASLRVWKPGAVPRRAAPFRGLPASGIEPLPHAVDALARGVEERQDRSIMLRGESFIGR